MDNSQRRIRSNIDFNVRLKSGNFVTLNAHAVNLSLNGILLEMGQKLPIQSSCTLEFSLGQGSIKFEVYGHVVRHSHNGIAVNFDKMDLEALHHLQNLVAYNSGDPEAVISQNKKRVGFK